MLLGFGALTSEGYFLGEAGGAPLVWCSVAWWSKVVASAAFACDSRSNGGVNRCRALRWTLATCKLVVNTAVPNTTQRQHQTKTGKKVESPPTSSTKEVNCWCLGSSHSCVFCTRNLLVGLALRDFPGTGQKGNGRQARQGPGHGLAQELHHPASPSPRRQVCLAMHATPATDHVSPGLAHDRRLLLRGYFVCLSLLANALSFQADAGCCGRCEALS